MIQRTTLRLLLILGIFTTVIPSLALAHNRDHGEGSGNVEKRQCLAEARTSFHECKQACWEDLKLGKSSCGINPDCHKVCSDAFKTCKETVEASLDTCLAACDAPLDDAKIECRVASACQGSGRPCFRDANFRSCVRPALLARFTCAQDCRDNFKTDPNQHEALKACFDATKDCHKDCNSAPPEQTPAAE